MKKNTKELFDLSVQELQDKSNTARQELFALRFHKRLTHIKDSSQFKKLKKNVARILTIKTQKENEVGK